MGYRIKRNLNEELSRINEIMVDNNPEILTEQPKPPAELRKVIDDVTGEIFTPEGMKKMFAKLGLNGLDKQMTKFVDNFDALRLLANTDGAWDDMISKAKNVKEVINVFDAKTGKQLSKSETDALYALDDGIDILLDSEQYIAKSTYYVLDDAKSWKEITSDMYDELIEGGGEYFDLPYYLRHSQSELILLLGDVSEGGIKTVDEFLVALKGFLRGSGKMTPPLRKSIIALMSETPGFAKIIRDALVKNNKFYKYTKLFRHTQKMHLIDEAISAALGLKQGSKLLTDLEVLMSKEGVLIGEWFDFVLQSWRPFRALNDLRFGITSSKMRTFVSDITMGSFFDYIMGAQILKTMYSSIKKMKGLPLISTKGNSVAAVLIITYVVVGGYRTIRDGFDTAGFNLKTIFDDAVGLFSNYCAGDNKIKDALTGALYVNAVGDKSDADGTRTSCGPVDFNTKFLESYTANKNNEKYKLKDVKSAALTLYSALNIDSHGAHPLTIFEKKGKKIPFTDINMQVPSITKIFREYLGMYTPDNEIVKGILNKPGMDILKMSQISNYYEKNFDASLLADMVNLDYWAGLTGGMDWKSAQALIEKLPYLDPGTGDLNFDTWKELLAENEKLFLRYPNAIQYETEIDGDLMMMDIDIAKCGSNCEGCKCNDGGCDIGGTMVSAAMGIALESEGYDEQKKFDALCKTADGFAILERIFNKTNNPTGTGCVLRRGRTPDNE